MQKNKKIREPLPKTFKTVDEFARFWDTHSTADYPEAFREIKSKVNLKHRRHFVAVRPSLIRRIEKRAQKEGVSTETLVNVWITEKLREAIQEKL